ncbi:MAG: alpha/beta hydrolase [Exilibacterium sp.]
MLNNFLIGIVFLTFSINVFSSESYPGLPEKVDPSQKYVFYSHGYIVEGKNEQPVNPKWGVYDFPAIKNKLSDSSYNLIAYHRHKNTDPFKYAKKLANEVNSLIDAGVPPKNIALVGFSRGGAITILASNELKNREINFAILAGCAGLAKNSPKLQLYGHVFSIYETSDQVGSCNFMKERSTGISSFSEIAISTGKEHGAFYLPRDEWVVPLKQWLQVAFR